MKERKQNRPGQLHIKISLKYLKYDAVQSSTKALQLPKL
jgi:hypothetical protein